VTLATIVGRTTGFANSFLTPTPIPRTLSMSSPPIAAATPRPKVQARVGHLDRGDLLPGDRPRPPEIDDRQPGGTHVQAHLTAPGHRGRRCGQQDEHRHGEDRQGASNKPHEEGNQAGQGRGPRQRDDIAAPGTHARHPGRSPVRASPAGDTSSVAAEASPPGVPTNNATLSAASATAPASARPFEPSTTPRTAQRPPRATRGRAAAGESRSKHPVQATLSESD
jgi:hypothetical protein